MDQLCPIMSTCVLNQTCCHWLLNDALHFSCKFSISLKLKEEINNPLLIKNVDDDSRKNFFTSNIKKEVCLTFPNKYEERKTHHMFSLMLNSSYKSLHIVFSFISCGQGVEIVKEYDRKNIVLGMFHKCYCHLYCTNCLNLKLLLQMEGLLLVGIPISLENGDQIQKSNQFC